MMTRALSASEAIHGRLLRGSILTITYTGFCILKRMNLDVRFFPQFEPKGAYQDMSTYDPTSVHNSFFTPNGQ